MASWARSQPLAPLTTIELGGPARWYYEARDEAALIDALREADRRRIPVCVLGGGSNVVFDDDGFDGLVLRVALDAERFEADGTVSVGAGMPWWPFVERAVARDLAGVECLAGIPGSAGATPIQNVGAYGQEVSEVVTAVRVYDREADGVVVFDAEGCGFGYRDSLFKRMANRYVVLDVTFQLRPGGAPTVRYAELDRSLGDTPRTLVAVKDAVLALRRKKSMVIDPDDENRRSVGSFFTNPIVDVAVAEDIAKLHPNVPRYPAGEGQTKLSAAWLIENAGIERGTRGDGVGVSTKHTLALVNLGDGTTAALRALAARIQSRVREVFGVALEPEARLIPRR
ncbi:MAG: UDP-N-acetylmuramate dehydrogenase [Deltaproteobacteria bacterium]|jgi:UDP-N-acetylmuramate dehydrogenase